ncbi:MAG: hydantoinase/oxoprolinase family protein [Deltaproteobacteria bacterium]|nr:hydantoinase/oxoprolinase family protein [Deltaproteobacteria bacterium]
MIRIGVDTGGTFTDFIVQDKDGLRVLKTLSTPGNPAEAVVSGIPQLAGDKAIDLIHGSTVATNALLEKKGAKIALVTNRGFEDILEIGRQNRSRLYDPAYSKSLLPVLRKLRFGVYGRIDKNGEEHESLDEDRLVEIAGLLRKMQVEAVAVCFLFSFLNPCHEKKAKDILASAGMPIFTSHEILSEFREFERTATTVINAYVAPAVSSYLADMETRIRPERFKIMQSNGGVISRKIAAAQPVRTILSGPAGGVAGAFAVGRQAGFTKLITFDMGGTSTDVSLIDNALSMSNEASVTGFPVRVPMIDIHTVGAGGGSIAAIDAGGALGVGPESAGADPGPACYGKGEKITVTDANLFCGRLSTERFLGGAMPLFPDRTAKRIKDMAKKAGLEPQELATGIIDIANTTMEKAIRVISVEKGYDPARFTLVSFGGAGGMHAVFLARLLHIPRVLVPKNPGLLSAFGMLCSDIIKDYSLTVMEKMEPESIAVIKKRITLGKRACADLAAEGVSPADMRLQQYVDMRYAGQSYEIIVAFDKNVENGFHRAHERIYGFSDKKRPVEIVNIRVRAKGKIEKPVLQMPEPGNEKPDMAALAGETRTVFDTRPVLTRIYERDYLRPKNRIYGPAIIREYSSTIVIPESAMAEVDCFGNLVIDTAC